MYVLYVSTLSFILFTLYNCFLNKTNKNLTSKKFDHKNNYVFIIKNIEFFKNGDSVGLTNYDNYYFRQNNIELNVNFLYDFFIVNYIYNNTKYKYYSNNSFLTFPMYSSEQIKNYVYINKITKAKLILKETECNENEIDILEMLLPFLGPNYNFYKDVEHSGIKPNIDKILIYLKYNNPIALDKLDIENKNYKLVFYDNFNNEYNLDFDHLIWNPELKL